MKIVWLTDLHYITDGSICGYDPRLRLQAAVAHINVHASDCAFCIVSGDLTDTGSITEYAGVKSILDALKLPYFVMMGNHDAHGPMRAMFDLPTNAMADFAQYVIETNVGQFICLDTKIEGTDGGYLCQERLTWLDRALAQAAGNQVYLFLHHPPARLNLPPFDEIGLQNRGDLMDVVLKHDCVAHIFAGHLHQSMSGQVRGVPYTVGGAIVYQSPPPLPPWDWDGFRAVPVPPTYGVVHLNGRDVVTHAIQFCDADFAKIE